ncbi:hypothetical protein Poly24_28550 [Rosistilla carotiformis]|uniref:Uncharacterized protein n=1 Tax=Rosistilla carotiformis TaxID=2528017 RepID=A0A518JUB8_9BACT|nr:hypothetical protein [Rosistilla carotiformis]QDV69141.1 hypothetical protein Poly24_28550 [Rosistilla carotiformis]
MADHIPNVTGDEAAGLASRYFGDSIHARVPLNRAPKLSAALPKSRKLWVDSCFDGFDDVESRRSKLVGDKNNWFDFMSEFQTFDSFCLCLGSPVQATVNAMVNELLDQCALHKPSWISVPQLPIVDGADRNKINRALAKATGNWKSSNGFSGRLILPLIFMHQKQLTKKTERNPKVQQAEKCYHDAHADGFWVVDQSLVDDSGSATLRQKRFPGILSLHEELNDRIPSKLKLGGPYWGLNIVLWAKGLIESPLIGVGSGYNYFVSGGKVRPPSARIAIPALRRRVKVTPELSKWLDNAMSRLSASHPARSEFADIKKNLTLFQDTTRAKEQVASFYKNWYDGIASVPSTGRSMALFQDLSAAYALGKSLPPFADEGTARRPESVAEPLMLSCL